MRFGHLKEGDEVIVVGGGRLIQPAVYTVLRTTKSQIILEGTTAKYRKSDGHCVGYSSGWYSTWLKIATPEEVAEIKKTSKRAKMVNALYTAKYSELSDSSVEALYKALQEAKK